MLNINAASLLQKQMDRKDFLKHVGIAAIALTGVSAIVKTLVDQPTVQNVQKQAGYGGSVYGGLKK